MAQQSPLLNPDKQPTKEDLEDYLGVGRYRRFEAIYDELVESNLEGQFRWSDLDKSWLLHFYKGKTPLFSIRWGIDYFYAYFILKIDDYKKIIRQESISSDARYLLQKKPPMHMKQQTPVEANLEMAREQEGFFDLLPTLIKVLT
ncbi:MAG: DUF3788 family protein [Fidelibacterota bacterium]|nr:MAG: DUF3788 family protein [Candidatus Neomarinimicrobiota bacterium]